MLRTVSFKSLCNKFIEQNKQSYIDKFNQHPSYKANNNKLTTQTQKITITLNELLEENKRVLEKDIKEIKKHLNDNPKLELKKPAYNAQEFDSNFFQTELNTPIIICRLNDPTPVYTIQNNYIFKVNSIEELKTYWLNKFIFFAFKTIKNEIILKLERDSKKLKKIQKSSENQIDLIISRNLLNHELADTEAQLERLEKTTKRYREEAIKARNKYKEDKDNEKLHEEAETKTIAYKNHKEMLDKFKNTPKNNYTPYEWQAIIAIGSLTKQKPKSKIPINPTKFFEVLGIEPKSNQSLNELRDAVLNLTKKPYYSSNLSYDPRKRAFIMTNQVNETPIFELHEINVAMEKNKKKAYGVKVANESILDDLDKNYLRILDILPQIHAYFARVDSYIYQLCTYIHNARMSYILGKYKQTQTTSIIELIKRTEKKNLLNDDMTGFNIRKNKHSQIKIITSVLEFFVKNNYMKTEFEIEKNHAPYKITMTFLGDENIKKIT
jgi:hypothetical protein